MENQTEKTEDEQPLIVRDAPADTKPVSKIGMGWVKSLALVLLVAQNASLVLTMRKARTDEGDKFLSTAAVFVQECLKVIASSVLLLVLEFGGSLPRTIKALQEEVIGKPMETLKVAVPSFIYTLQNNLLYVAVSNLPAATFQVTYQLKILTTAMFSVTMLNKTLSRTQWLSMVLLFTGVAIVQSQDVKETTVDSSAQSKTIGFVAVLVSCISSGFAGVYFEKILKGSTTSLWLRNIQLGIFAALLAFATMMIKDGEHVQQHGIFFGFNSLAWTVVVNQAFGGLLVAVVMKYADNIIKGFATSIAIVLSTVLSIFLFGFELKPLFIVGSALVISAVYIYSLPPAQPNRSQISKV